MRTILARAAPLAVALGLLVPVAASAQVRVAISFDSSVGVTCANAGCTELLFELNIPLTQYVNTGRINQTEVAGGTFTFQNLRTFSLFTLGPAFASIVEIYSANGAHYPAGTWSAYLEDGGLTLESSSGGTPHGASPFFVRAAMTGNASMATFAYGGAGRALEDGGLNRTADFSIAGNTSVVPEPITMILMGTGLAGVAAMRRRRVRVETEA
jgi:hypothetical protein